jgi:hypothetical protein
MSRRRILLFAVLALGAAVLAAAVIALREPGIDPYQQAAQQRCEQDVLGRLAAPSTGTLSEVAVSPSELDPEITDLSTLSRETLEGVDRSRITVLAVSGTVSAPNAFGDILADPFTCRAYFVDGTLAETLVVFEHDH